MVASFRTTRLPTGKKQMPCQSFRPGRTDNSNTACVKKVPTPESGLRDLLEKVTDCWQSG
jgi:hypothetical protein